MRERPVSKIEAMSASDFAAECVDVLDRLAARKLDRVIITQGGRAVAVLTRPEDEADAVRRIHGFMRGAVVIPPGFDLTAPVLDGPVSGDRDANSG